MTATRSEASAGRPAHVQLALAKFDAIALDLDGVVTRTATVHAAAWKRTFDELLEHVGRGEPFDIEHDYRTYVDGKPRRDGIRAFLAARALALPDGDPLGGPTPFTIAGLAALKNRRFLALLEEHGVDVYRDSLALVARVRAHGWKTAVVSASENGRAVLAAARLIGVFDAVVDGHDLARLGLRGKPAPDSFLEAARQLGTDPGRCIVVEDAIAGVRAGRAGSFGLVIGVVRGGDAAALCDAGADAVVTTLDELELIGAEPR